MTPTSRTTIRIALFAAGGLSVVLLVLATGTPPVGVRPVSAASPATALPTNPAPGMAGGPARGPAPAASGAPDRVRFNRDIRPILSDNCFACHGPDKNHRKGDLRLDVREDAVGKKAVVPGKPADSALVARINSSDPDERMPPAESHKTLTAGQKALLARWIAEGAEYEGHWAYQVPVKPAVPAGVSAIDHLITAKLRPLGLALSPEADRRTLARRLSQDLLGLPPSVEEVETFAADRSPDAYAKYVERLLASPHHGERMAVMWLDAVRFADTIGYHSDNPRNVWPYRDWVIRSFRENKRFDRFTREQLAGDLLPGSGVEEKIGSAFNRLLLTTEEGGAQAKDYEARMFADRVRAVGSVWLGQTLGCAQCHDHKFDPTTARDFYSMAAFFADVQEASIGRREPGMIVPDPTRAGEAERLAAEVARLEAELAAPHPELAAAQTVWESAVLKAADDSKTWTPVTPATVTAKNGTKFRTEKDGTVVGTNNPRGGADVWTAKLAGLPAGTTALRLDFAPDATLPAKGPGRATDGSFVISEAVLTDAAGKPVKVGPASATSERPDRKAATVVDGVIDKTNGWAPALQPGAEQTLVLGLAAPLPDGATELTLTLHQLRGDNRIAGRFRVSATALPGPHGAPGAGLPAKDVLDIVRTEPAKRSPAAAAKLAAHFATVAPSLAPLREKIAAAKKAVVDHEATLPRCLVSVSVAPRTVKILPRGNFLDDSGPVVQPAFPHHLVPAGAREVKPDGARPADAKGAALAPREDAGNPLAAATPKPGKAGKAARSKGSPPDPTPGRLTRLDLADWLVSRSNPLTARVTVNRVWKLFFGTGLCRTMDDFGSQGEWPPNPELLDWLACEFVDSGWDVRHMIRLIVHSAAYRQVSTGSRELLALDPDNRLLARQSRWRLDAEFVRDNALTAAGLLDPKIGGPSVKPYQPDGYWENLNFPTRTWQADAGGSQHRRGLYTWWQRSFLHPSMLAFDAPPREECCAERNRSNIPQQALVLLNDPTYVEAARVLAAAIVRDGGATTESRVRWAYRRVLQRDPQPAETATVTALQARHLADYKADPAAAEALLKVGISPAPPAGMDRAEVAAWTGVARVLLNLHETITRN